MIYSVSFPEEGDEHVRRFFIEYCKIHHLDNLPPWPEAYANSHAWAKDIQGDHSHLVRVFTRPDPNNLSGNVVVRFVPVDRKVEFFDDSYSHFTVAFRRFGEGRWEVEFQPSTMDTRIQERLLKGLMQFVP